MVGGRGLEGPAVTAKGKCTRTMYAGVNQHIIKQRWIPEIKRGPQSLRLVTILVDTRARRHVGEESMYYS